MACAPTLHRRHHRPRSGRTSHPCPPALPLRTSREVLRGERRSGCTRIHGARAGVAAPLAAGQGRPGGWIQQPVGPPMRRSCHLASHLCPCASASARASGGVHANSRRWRLVDSLAEGRMRVTSDDRMKVDGECRSPVWRVACAWHRSSAAMVQLLLLEVAGDDPCEAHANARMMAGGRNSNELGKGGDTGWDLEKRVPGCSRWQVACHFWLLCVVSTWYRLSCARAHWVFRQCALGVSSMRVEPAVKARIEGSRYPRQSDDVS